MTACREAGAVIPDAMSASLQPALLSRTPNLSDRLKRVSGLVELTPSGKAFRLELLEFAMVSSVIAKHPSSISEKARLLQDTPPFFGIIQAAMPSGSLYETALYSLTPLARSAPRVGATDSSVSLRLAGSQIEGSLRAFDLNILQAVPSAAYGTHTGSILPAAAAGHNSR